MNNAIQSFKILNKHQKFSIKRKSNDSRRQQIGIAVFVCALLFSFGALIVPELLRNREVISTFALPALIILDFSFRFFIKKNSSAMIFPYLTLPIPRKTLLRFIVISDLQKFGIWGIVLIYCAVLLFFGVFTFWNVLLCLLFVLLNNYLIAFLKTQFGAYSFLLYPFVFIFVGGLLFLANLLHPIFTTMLLMIIVYGSFVALFYSLKEKLHEELNRFAL